jgi:hypothetical protein
MPAPLLVSAVLVALQGFFFVGYAILEVLHLSGARLTMGLTTSAFFAAYGALLLAGAWAFTRGDGWARSPVVLAQIITVLVAWGFRGGETTVVAVTAAVIAIVSLAGIFHPASVSAFDADPSS